MFLALLQDLLFQIYHHIYHGSDFQAFYALAIFLLMAWGLSKIDTIRRKYLDISDFKFNIIFIPSCLLFHFLTIVIYSYFFEEYYYSDLVMCTIIGLVTYFAQHIFIKTLKMQNGWRLISLLAITFFISLVCLIISIKEFDSFLSPLIATLLPLISLFVANSIKNEYLNISNRTFYFTIILLYSVINAIFSFITFLLPLGTFPGWNGLWLIGAPIGWEFELAIYLIICFVIFIIKKIINKSSNAQ
mgnify:FL=1